MSDDTRPNRRLNIPDETPPVSTDAGPRRLSIPDAPKLPEMPERPQRARRTILTDGPPPPPTPAAPERQRTVINPPPVASAPKRVERAERPKTKTDELLEKAHGVDPSVPMGRLKGRIDTILAMSVSDILDWGQRNLTPLQNVSGRKAKIAADISRINASTWLQEALNASCKVPGFLDRFTAKPPAYYEGMLKKVRGELLVFVKELDQMKAEFFREIGDLHCDALAMMVSAEEFPDDQAKNMAVNRAKTLMMSHQTAAMLQQTIENSLSLSAKYIQQIDDFMSVTLPNWSMAYGAK
jgi:hypothetical protein